MKYTALVSQNNYSTTHGREYPSKSPKPASTYSEGFGFQYNSPKATPAKGFVLPKSNNENLTLLTQSQKFESALTSKTKNLKSSAITLGVSSPSQKAIGGYSYNSQGSGMRTSAVKAKADVIKASTPKGANNYKSAEPLKSREEASNDPNQYKWKKLEISTEFNNGRNSYGTGNKAQTTKNTEVDDHLQKANNGGYQLYTQQGGNQRAGRDERPNDPKTKQSRPLSSGETNKNATPTKSSSNGIFGSRATPAKENLKKPSTATLKTTGTVQQEERLSQSSAFNAAKKAPVNSQVDLRSSWQNNNDKRVQRPLSAKKPSKEETQASRPSTASKEAQSTATPASTASKSSLNSFVTKVNQGDLFGGAKGFANSAASSNTNSAANLSAKKREASSSKRVGQKPALTLEERSSSKTDVKGPKTTTNNELKTFTINLGKNSTPSAASSQKNATRNGKYGASTAKDKIVHEVALRKNQAQDNLPFIYYMSGLERAHRHTGEIDYFTQIYREHFIQSYQALNFCKMLKTPDPAVIAQKRSNLPRRDTHKDKKTLVFDMDETLIHCNESADMPADVILPIVFPNGEVVEAGVNIRPYAIECLRELSQHFEIIVFTASHACYANVVLDYLDPHEQYIHHRLFRDSCVVTDEGVHIKDLRVIGNRNLSDMLLIDNAAYSFGFQIENGIPIIPFYDNKTDQELLHLIPYLKFLGSTKDMRDMNKQTFKFDVYHAHESPDMVLDRLFL